MEEKKTLTKEESLEQVGRALIGLADMYANSEGGMRISDGKLVVDISNSVDSPLIKSLNYIGSGLSEIAKAINSLSEGDFDDGNDVETG